MIIYDDDNSIIWLLAGIYTYIPLKPGTSQNYVHAIAIEGIGTLTQQINIINYIPILYIRTPTFT